MSKPIDGTAPSGREPEEMTGTREISWQAAMDSPKNAPGTPARTPPEPEKEPASGGGAGDAGAPWPSLGIPPLEPADAAAPHGAKGKAERGKGAKARALPPGPFAGGALGPVVAAKAMTRDEEGVLTPTPATPASRLFTVLAFIPLLLPVALYLLQVAFSLDARSLWYSDEVRYAGAYRSMVDSGNWLVMHLDGAVYPDKPPLFFWFLRGLDEAVKALMPLAPFSVTVTETMLFFAGAALSGLLCLVAAHALASLVARVDRRTVLAADLILVSGFFFAALAHYLRMDFLFTACITLSHVFLFHAWVRDRAPLLMALGFLFAGAAVLVKGPLGLALPLLTGPCFLIWQGRFPRFFRPDFLCGLIAGLAVPGVWLALAYLDAGDAFVNNILHKQVLARALDAWHHAEPWYHYLATFPLIWLPWTPALLFLPWGRFMNKEMREGLAVSRTRDGAGIAYCWCAVLSGFVLLSLVSIKLPVYCLPLFPPAAILCARAVLRMRPFAAACLQYSLALLLLVLGLGLVLMPAVPGDYLPLPYVPKGVTALGGICLFFACAFAFLVKPRRGEGVILFTAVFTTVFMYPAWTATAPSLDAFLSPRAQAGVLKTYMDAGYFPAAFKVYPGTYTYYAGNVRECPNWEDVLARMDANPRMVLATRASLWDKMENRPEGFVEAHRQTIAEREYVLVARPPLAGTAELPADAPEAAFPEAVRPPAAEGSGESPAASVPEPSHPAAEPASPGTGAPAGP